MKGVIFTEFVDFVTEEYGLMTADHMIEQADLPSKGIYTAVGLYDVRELEMMACRLSELTATPVPMIMRNYGYKLFFTLADQYPAYAAVGDAFELLASLHEHVHVEIRKLYPKAELPEFTHRMLGPSQMLLVYKSKNGLADLVEGFITGCFDYYRDDAIVSRQDLSGGMGTHVRFTLRRLARV